MSPLRAAAVPEFYAIDPEASWVEIDATSGVQLLFFGTVSGADVPLVSQVGAGGTGGSLPDGSTSDGLRTALQGRLLIDVTGAGTRRIDIINRRTRIGLSDSGTWLPGVPGDVETPAPAGLAFRLSGVPLGFDGRAAIRGVEFSIGHSGFDQVMNDLGEGMFTFPFGFAPGGGPPLSPFPVDGVWDYETSLAGAAVSAGHGRLITRAANNPFLLTSQGTFVEQEAGGRQVTIPIEGAVYIGEDTFEIGGPFLLRLELRGQIVAATPTFVPEPGASASGLTVAGMVAALRRRRHKGPALSRSQKSRRMIAAGLIFGLIYVACLPPQQLSLFASPVEKVEPGTDCTAGEAGEETTATYDGGVFLEQVDGEDACSQAAAGQGQEGNVDVAGEATVQTGFFNFNSGQAKIELSCATDISGGQPSQPTDCTTRVTHIVTHSGSSIGATVSFGAWQHSFGAGADAPVSASARVDCGVDDPVALPINGGLAEIPVEDVDFTCTVYATLDGGTDAEGQTVQTLNIIAMPTPVQCEAHEDCRQLTPETPFCVTDVGCTDGALGSTCQHDSQCDDGIGLFCGSSLQCDDGDVGTFCQGVADCADGLSCDSFECIAGE